jgi:hypothetical protein
MIKPGRQFCQVLGPARGVQSVTEGEPPPRVPVERAAKMGPQTVPLSYRGGRVNREGQETQVVSRDILSRDELDELSLWKNPLTLSGRL